VIIVTRHFGAERWFLLKRVFLSGKRAGKGKKYLMKN